MCVSSVWERRRQISDKKARVLVPSRELETKHKEKNKAKAAEKKKKIRTRGKNLMIISIEYKRFLSAHCKDQKKLLSFIMNHETIQKSAK